MDQNKRLVENSKAIEQRYNEVSEIAKKAVDKSAKTRDHIYIEKENAQMLTTQRPDFEAIAGNKSPKHDTLHKVPPKPTKQKPKKKQEEPELKESLKRTVERKAPENSGQPQSNQHFANTLPLPSEQPPAQARAAPPRMRAAGPSASPGRALRRPSRTGPGARVRPHAGPIAGRRSSLAPVE